MPPALFLLVIFEIRSLYCPGWPGLQFSHLMLAPVSEVIGMHHPTQHFSTKMEFFELFTWDGLGM
jgi:hypothetical protein